MNLRFFAWIDQRESDYLRTRSEAIRRVKETFDEAGIEMPEPIYRVHLTEKVAGAGPARSTATKAAAVPGEDTTADEPTPSPKKRWFWPFS